ncbi:MAG: hypothetical protein PHQ23_07125 [Candidatus Wallbacteria bacterium]|nr:hypothetical protein [Candidatus Wallbacteria bacterium]
MLEKLKHLDRRIIYVCLALSVVLPMLMPIGLPVTVSREVKSAFEFIDKLPAGSRVLFSNDYDPSSKAELYPMNVALLAHCFRNKIRVVAMALWPMGGTEMNNAFNELKVEFPDIRYGVDYINMGYKAGQSIVINSIGTDFTTAFPSVEGKKVRDIPILQDVNDYSSFNAIINLSAGTPGTKEWIAFAGTKFNIPTVSGCTAVSAPDFYPYFQSKQLFGLLPGLAGAAEYEYLVKRPGKGLKGMDAQSMAHLVIGLFIILGNCIVFYEKFFVRAK